MQVEETRGDETRGDERRREETRGGAMRARLPAFLAAVVLAACGSNGNAQTMTEPSPSPGPVQSEPPATEDQPGTMQATVESATNDPVRSITVGGMGAEYGPPDRCVVDIGVEVQRATVREASDAAAAAADSMVGALVANGVPADGIQSSDFSINPVHDQYMYNIISGYAVHLGYRVIMPDIGEVGGALAEAIAAGGDSVRAWGVRFEGDPAGLTDSARIDAWTDVRARAEATAELAGEPLGQVLDVHEKILVTSPQGMMQGGEGDSASFDIPVSPGVVGVVVLLTVTYAVGN